LEESNKAHILIVDDNPYNLELLSRRLERRGYAAESVDSGEKALARLDQGGVDLMLLDIMMPGLNGLDVLRRAREKFAKSALPIIMVTSKGESEDVVEALNLGANDYVVKPVDFPVALARIQTQLSQKREFEEKKSRPSSWASFEPGETFGPYRIEEKIGQGAMGAVYKAHDPSLDRVVALKVILPGHDFSAAQIERFNREARAIARIKHPNIVAVYQIGEEPQYYYAMEFIEGRNLSQLIKSEGFQPLEAAAVCAKIASALHVAHERGVVHRDLKPSNVMIDAAREPHLTDFGLAKVESEEEQLTRTGDVLGTPEYMAPEQIDPSCGDVGAPSDIYALGAILFEMLTGTMPFAGTPIRVLWQKLNQPPRSPRALNPAVPEELEAICLKAMAKQPAARHATARDLADALAALG